MRSTSCEALVAVVDALAQVDPDGLCAAELQELVAVVGPQIDRLAGVLSAAVGALQVTTGGSVALPTDDRAAPGPVVTVRHWLRDTLSCGAPAASSLVRVGVDLRALPLVAAAVREGTVTAEQARILTRLLASIPLEQLLEGQRELVQVASTFDPQGLAAWVRHAIATWCEPQFEHDHRTAQARRYLQTRDNGDGTTRGSFVLPTEDMECFHTVVEPLARPTGLDEQRSAGQRRADALVEVMQLAARAADLPDSGGLPTQVHYVVPARWGAQQAPPPFASAVSASLPGGAEVRCDADAGHHVPLPVPPAGSCAIGVWTGPQSRSRIETMLCDARISRVLLTPAGQVTGLESVTGEITRAQRRALIARDRGCAARGCTRPPAFCDAHHLTHREDGGETTVDNLVLLCRRHHLLWHQGRLQLRQLHVPWLADHAESSAGPPRDRAA